MNELQLLTLVAVFTATMWLPYVLERILRQGLLATVGYPDEASPPARWAARAQKAHANAVENLVVFAALLLAAYSVDALGSLTLLATQLYAVSRVAHYIVYLLAIPWLRTLAFFAGYIAQLMLAWAVLNASAAP